MAEMQTDGMVDEHTLQADVCKALKDCNADRQVLEKCVAELVANVRLTALEVMEEATAGQPEIRRILRKRILDSAGHNTRLIASILNNWVVWQVRTQEIVTKTIANPDDAWRLPPGVKMPAQRPTAP